MAEFSIEPARPEDAPRLPGIEARAATLLSPEDLPPEIAVETSSVETFARAAAEARLLVARSETGQVVGFAHLRLVDGGSHLEELDVDPPFGRRGIGRALVHAAIDWARARGDRGITLSTFGHVAWNAPFYASMGFEIVEESELSEAFLALRRTEHEMGLDTTRRVIMRRAIEPA